METLVEEHESVDHVIAAIDELRPRTRKVFVLCRVRGMRRKAVARRLDIPVSAVEKHMIRAIAHLSVSLDNNQLLEKPIATSSKGIRSNNLEL